MNPKIVAPPPGPKSIALSERLASAESPAVDARRRTREVIAGAPFAPIVYASASGPNVVDVDGNTYVDLAAGFGALVLGHPPNAASDAMLARAATLPLALGDLYPSEDKVRLVETLASFIQEDACRVMLGLSGADAVTCALKTALLTTGKPGIVAFTGAYHGLSHGPLAACGYQESFREPFAAHLGVPVTFAPYPKNVAELDASLSAVRAALATEQIGAVLVEPILGRGGIVVPPVAFLGALRSLTYEVNALLILDEVWTGIGRTGAMLASDHIGVLPDLVCVGKGLGGGAPISACIGRATVMEAWGAHGGSTIHTGTHFGSPPACAAALATLLEVSKMLDDVAAAGDAWRDELASAVGDRATIRGRGLMAGVALADGAVALRVARTLLAHGYLVVTGGTGGEVLTLSPPLNTPRELLSGFARTLGDVI